MLFNSILPLSLFCLYLYFVNLFLCRTNWKIITILFSIFFYAYWNILFLPSAIIRSTLYMDSLATRYKLILHTEKKYLIMGMVLPLIILFIFKYFNFFISDVLQSWTSQDSIFTRIILPIGISFYTFQAIMYVVDVYKNKLNKINIKDFLVFFPFFPNLIAGPLVRPNSVYSTNNERNKI